MKILDDLISSLDYDAAIRDIRLGMFQTAVYTRRCGLASTPQETGYIHGDSPIKDAGMMLDKDIRDLVKMSKSESLYEATIGMAALNSLIEVNIEKCRELNAAILLSEKSAGKKAVIVGHFPFLSQLRGIAEELWVIEKNPAEGEFSEEEAERLIPQADVVGITGMAVTNHTLGNLLNYCRTGTYTMILGGTTPLSPVLFDYGVDALSGTVVTEPEPVLEAVSQGATYRQLKGVRRLIMEK